MYWREHRRVSTDYPDCFSLYPQVDYVKLAESMGVRAVHLAAGGCAGDAARWLLADRKEPALLEIRLA